MQSYPRLDDMERRDLLLYLLSKVDSVGTTRKFHSIIYLLNQENGICDDYDFKQSFLSKRDENLQRDLTILALQAYADYIPTMDGPSPEKMVKINDFGKLYMHFFRTPNKLKNILTPEKLEKIERGFVKYNSVPLNDILYRANMR
jgi:hypothetical protein